MKKETSSKKEKSKLEKAIQSLDFLSHQVKKLIKKS